MEASVLFMIMAGVCACAAAYSLVLSGAYSYRKRLALLSAKNMKPSLRALAILRVEDGVPSLMPLTNLLLRQTQIATLVERAVRVIRSKHVELPVTRQSLSTLLVTCIIAILVVTFVLTRSLVAACTLAICGTAAAIAALGSAEDKLQNELREEIPSILELMGTCFASGFTLLQTFQQIASERKGGLGSVFARGAHIMETGGSISEALGVLRMHADVSELTFVIAALEVQHQNGGALSTVLATAAESVKNEIALKQTLRTQTAQAKLSARIVMVMPFVLIALFSLVSPNFLVPFFSSLAGYVLFGIAVLMEVAGIILVKRSLCIGGLS